MLDVYNTVSKFHQILKQDIFLTHQNPNKLEGESITSKMKFKNKIYLLKMAYDKLKFILSLRACRPSMMLKL